MTMNTLIQKTKTPGWWSEPKHVATAIVGLAFFGGLAYGFLTYVLPWLVTVTWKGEVEVALERLLGAVQKEPSLRPL